METLPNISFCLFVLLFLGQANPTPDKWPGTWRLNPGKSHYEGGILPKSRTLSFTPVSGGVKAVSDLLDDVGIVHIEFEAKFGGPDVPMRGGNPGPTMAIRRTDAYTFDTFQKSQGKVMVTTHYVVSRDGKSLTATANGFDESGKKYTNISVYDKQP
jgi:hypothetical protein